MDIKNGTIKLESLGKAGGITLLAVNPTGKVVAAQLIYDAKNATLVVREILGISNIPIPDPKLGFWNLEGNDSTTASNFLGTTDNNPLFFKINNEQEMVLGSDGLYAKDGLSTDGDFNVGGDASFARSVSVGKIIGGLDVDGTTTIDHGGLFLKGGNLCGKSTSKASKVFAIMANDEISPGPYIEMCDREHPGNSGDIIFNAYSKAAGKGNVIFNLYDSPTSTFTQTVKIKPDGIIYARGIKVQTTAFPDYVFGKDYKMLSLKELEQYIAINKHLPGIPSAKEVTVNEGMELGEMNRLLLEKVEEQTLYILQLQKRMDALEVQLSKKE